MATPTQFIDEIDAQMSAIIGAQYDALSTELKTQFWLALGNTIDLWTEGGTGLSGVLPGIDHPSVGGGDHSTLSALVWDGSGHTGTALAAAGFNGAGAAAYLVIGSDLQAWDADTDALAALGSTGFAVRTGANTWAQRTLATGDGVTVTNGSGVAGNPSFAVTADVLRDADVGSQVQAYSANLDVYAANPLTAAELGQLQNINATTISTTQWGYLGAMTSTPLLGGEFTADGQFLVGTGLGTHTVESGDTARISLGVGTTDSPTFTGLTLTTTGVALTLAAGSDISWASGAEFRTGPAGNVNIASASGQPIQLRPADVPTIAIAVGGGIVFDEQATAPATTAGHGAYWFLTDSTPWVTDDTGTDWELARHGDDVSFDSVKTGLTSNDALRLRSGEPVGSVITSQILMSYNGLETYTHNIRSVHDGSTQAGNELRFYMWDQSVDTTATTGTKQVFSLYGDGNVQITAGDLTLADDQLIYFGVHGTSGTNIEGNDASHLWLRSADRVVASATTRFQISTGGSQVGFMEAANHGAFHTVETTAPIGQAGFGAWWFNSADSRPWITDDSSVDYELALHGTSVSFTDVSITSGNRLNWGNATWIDGDGTTSTGDLLLSAEDTIFLQPNAAKVVIQDGSGNDPARLNVLRGSNLGGYIYLQGGAGSPFETQIGVAGFNSPYTEVVAIYINAQSAPGNVGILGSASTTHSLKVHGNQAVDGDIEATGVIQGASGGSGNAFKVGDDAYLVDISVANTLGIQGVSNAAIAQTRYGSAGGYIYGFNGLMGVSTTAGRVPQALWDVDGKLRVTGTYETDFVSLCEPVFIRGTGLLHNATRIVRVGNTEHVNSTGIGLTLVILTASTHAHVSTTNYNTFGAAADQLLLATALDNLTRDQIGIIASYDAWESSHANMATLRASAERLGLFKLAHYLYTSSNRHPYCAIFRGSGTSTGNTEKNVEAIEVLVDDAATAPYAEIATWMIEDTFIQPSSVNALVSGVAESGMALWVSDNNEVRTNLSLHLITDSTRVSWYNGGAEEGYISATSSALQYNADGDHNFYPGNAFMAALISGGGLKLVERASTPTSIGGRAFLFNKSVGAGEPWWADDTGFSYQLAPYYGTYARKGAVSATFTGASLANVNFVTAGPDIGNHGIGWDAANLWFTITDPGTYECQISLVVIGSGVNGLHRANLEWWDGSVWTQVLFQQGWAANGEEEAISITYPITITGSSRRIRVQMTSTATGDIWTGHATIKRLE